MRDFNFFSPYIESKKTSTTKYIYISSVIFLIVAIVGGTLFYTGRQIKQLNKEINGYQTYLNSQEVIEKLRDVEEKKKRVMIMKEYQSTLEDIHAKMDYSSKTNSLLLNQISSSVPQNLFLKNMSVSNEIIQLQGISENRVSIAEFERNLKNLDVFREIHVSRINRESEESNSYVFALIATFKDVRINEDK